jgi:hypothetical protein
VYWAVSDEPEGLPPCSNQFRLAPFKLKILFTFFTKQATLMWRSNVLSLPLRFYSLDRSLYFKSCHLCRAHHILQCYFLPKTGALSSSLLKIECNSRKECKKKFHKFVKNNSFWIVT